MRLLALFGPFTHRNDRFPFPFSYFNLWNPYNFIYLKPEKGTPFRRSLPVWAIIGRIPGGFWNHCRLFRTGAQGWNSEGKITYFCVKQDTIGTVSNVTATFQYSLCESFEPRSNFISRLSMRQPVRWSSSESWLWRLLPGTGCRNGSHCQQQQSNSGLRSPGRSYSTYLWILPLSLKLDKIRMQSIVFFWRTEYNTDFSS